MKLKRLKKILTSMRSILIGYSGNVDGSFFKLAGDVLDDKVVAFTATYLTY